MVALTCYFDDSFDKQVHVVAGYIASVGTWEHFLSSDWNEVIDSAPHKISEFKASDCRQQRGEFSEWTKAECDDLTKRLVLVIARTKDIAGFAAAFCYPGEGATREDRKGMEHSAYGMTFGMCLNDALSLTSRVLQSDRIHSIQPFIDIRKGFYERAVMNFSLALKYLDPAVAPKVLKPMPRDSRVPGIQAADLLAYETRKEVWNRIEKRKVSSALQRLVNGPLHLARCFQFPDLEDYRRQMSAGIKPRVTGHVLYRPWSPVREGGNWNC